jgi:hypothetical protein
MKQGVLEFALSGIAELELEYRVPGSREIDWPDRHPSASSSSGTIRKSKIDSPGLCLSFDLIGEKR